MIIRRLLALIAVFFLLNAATTAHAQNQPFYWKDSYGRGVGTIPALECPAGKERGGGLCYDACEGEYDMNEAASLCMIECPHGYADNGLVCHYTGSISYVPKSEWDSCKTRTKKSCTKIFGKKTCVGGDCIGGLVTDCRDGYKNVAGVCWFNASVPQGFSGTNLDPMKPSYAPKNPVAQVQVCRDNKILQDGLCYESCRSGFHGIGPVCWADTPKGFVDCFTGYARSQSACASVMGAQTLAVGIPAMKMTVAAWKAREATKAAQNAAMAGVIKGLGEDLAVTLFKHPDDMAKLLAEVAENAAKGKAVASTNKVIEFLKWILTDKAIAAMATAGYQGVTKGMKPSEYWATRNAEEYFARARDAAQFMSLVCAFVSIPLPSPNPVDTAEAIFDITGAFMYTVYGQ